MHKLGPKSVCHGRVLLHEDVIGRPVAFRKFESCRWLQLENCISSPSVIFPYLPFTEFQGRHWMKGIPGAFIFCLKYSFAINYLIQYLLHHSFTDILQSSLKKKSMVEKALVKSTYGNCISAASHLKNTGSHFVSLKGETKFEQKDPALPVCIFQLQWTMKPHLYTHAEMLLLNLALYRPKENPGT